MAGLSPFPSLSKLSSIIPRPVQGFWPPNVFPRRNKSSVIQMAIPSAPRRPALPIARSRKISKSSARIGCPVRKGKQADGKKTSRFQTPPCWLVSSPVSFTDSCVIIALPIVSQYAIAKKSKLQQSQKQILDMTRWRIAHPYKGALKECVGINMLGRATAQKSTARKVRQNTRDAIVGSDNNWPNKGTTAACTDH